MKKMLMGCLVAAVGVMSAAAAGWEDDLAKGTAAAQASGRFILVNFSGSDWCGWCKRLDREVFSQREFKNYAASNLVCVVVDFPRFHSQPRSHKERNESLARKYGVEGFPTVLLLSPAGEVAARTGYQPGGARAYVEHLQQLLATYQAKKNPAQ